MVDYEEERLYLIKIIINYNLRLNIGVFPLFCEKMVDYEEERLYLIKSVDPVQEFPGSNFSHIFLTSLFILVFQVKSMSNSRSGK